MTPRPTLRSFPQRKESFLCCLIGLGATINELFVCVRLSGGNEKRTIGDTRRAKSKKKKRKPKKKKNGDRSSNRGRLFWGLSIKAISTDWLCHCVTQSCSLETLCVCVCVSEQKEGVRGLSCFQNREATRLFWKHSSNPILWSHTPEREQFFFFAPPPCSQFMSVFVWVHERGRRWLFNETREQSMCCAYGQRF